MNSDFTRVTKYLDITPSSKSDRSDLKQNKGIFKSRAIKKIPAVVTLAAHTETGVSTAWPRIVFQYNITVGSPFYLSNIDELRSGYVLFRTLERSLLTLRFRNGEAVTRYYISARGDFRGSRFLAETYINQEIPENFVIEVWSVSGTTWGLNTDLDIKLSQRYNPANADELKRVVATPTIVRDEIFQPMPMPVPIPFGESSAWLDN